jgi:hypothetical protein
MRVHDRDHCFTLTLRGPEHSVAATSFTQAFDRAGCLKVRNVQCSGSAAGSRSCPVPGLDIEALKIQALLLTLKLMIVYRIEHGVG